MSPDMDRILKNARIHVPGALDDVLKLELYNVAREYCDGSDVWRQDVPVKIVAGRTQYNLLATDAEPARLIALADQTGSLVPATMSEPGTITLHNEPSSADQFTATVSLLPDKTDSDGVPIIPGWIVKKYWEDLKHGLVARMMAHPQKPYTNPALALYHMREFRSGMAVAKANATHTNLYSGQTWRFPQSFATRKK